MITPTEIKKLRADKAWSQKDLAERCGVSVRTCENWEQGRTKISGSALMILNGLINDRQPK